LLDGILESRFLRFLLGIREPDAALRGPLVVVGRGEVIAAVGHPVAVSQELLLVAEIGPKRIRLFLRVEPLCFAHGYSIEAAQYELPWPGQYIVWAVEALAVRFYKDLVYYLEY
jgi:hypothetical protein